MKKMLCLALASSFGVALCLADPKDDVAAAIKKLAGDNYSWTQTMEMANSQFNMPPLQGKIDKDGTMVLTRENDQGTTMAVVKGEKGVMKTEDGWQTMEEMRAARQGGGGGGGGGRGGFMAMGLLRSRAPAAEAENLLSKVKDIKAGSDGVFTAALTEAGVKELATFGGRGGRRGGAGGGGGNFTPPEPKNGKGTVKFTVKDGVLTGLEYNVQYTMTGRNGEDRDIDRTTKVEIKNVGSTKVSVPAEAKSKLNS